LSSDAAERPTPAGLLPIPLLAKIPKPRGEVSRISRGGYNLQEALGWPAAEYEETRVRILPTVVYCLFNYFFFVQAFVSQLAREYLKVNKSWRFQAQPKLALVYAEVGIGLVNSTSHSSLVGTKTISNP
jgi:hypothetical protein